MGKLRIFVVQEPHCWLGKYQLEMESENVISNLGTRHQQHGKEELITEIPTKKIRSRKALKQKNSPNILPLEMTKSTGKENLGSLLGNKKQSKEKNTERSFEEELKEMQEKMEKLTIEKEEAEKKAREKEEMLREREKEQEKMMAELRKLQKMKEFKPTMTLPIVQSLKERDQNEKDKKKGAGQIKKPSTPYILWCKDQWSEVKKENPGAEFKEISNILGAKWKTVTAEEKKPYEEKYRAEREAYLEIIGNEKRENEAMRLLEEEQKQRTAMELLDQYLQFKEGAEKDNKKTKKEKDPLKPKKPLSAFFVFTNGRRAELLAENKKIMEVSKITGEEWKNMTEKQKKPYEEIAKQNKEKYVEEMEAYKQKKEEEASALKTEEEELMKIHKQEALQLLKKKEKTDNIIKKTKAIRQKKKEGKNDDPNKPKRPASSFLLFSKQARKDLLEERPGINNSTIITLISVKWKELNDEGKKVWNEKAAEAMDAYKKHLEDYNKSKDAAERNTKE